MVVAMNAPQIPRRERMRSHSAVSDGFYSLEILVERRIAAVDFVVS